MTKNDIDARINFLMRSAEFGFCRHITKDLKRCDVRAVEAGEARGMFCAEHAADARALDLGEEASA